MALWTTRSLQSLVDTIGPAGRAEAVAELRATIAGREPRIAGDIALADTEITRIAAVLLDDLSEPHLLQLRAVDRPDATRLATTPTGRDLRTLQLRHAERMRRQAVAVLCAEPPDTGESTHVRYLATATGMLAFGDYYELVALIVTFPFDGPGDPRRQRGAQEMSMAVQATAATRALFEVGLTAPVFDTGYQSMWIRLMADARERDLLPTLSQWRRWTR
ncbi:hypothetical protein [Actinoplanes derwentensis]|uniref:Uncharacterized protein n=1 Tax=Actinoplanes derwentensis TaxID=113562 RepID=A0A1H2BHS7_9ACTN|nr:hypothetical protein [Actinoplanes derwentensis]GID87826.1 hypothetical protein Ade03nite_67500 [Actinoplanes derwentensis]SDT57738.1 hypothetical protein SAMN04489716_4623 [Actinoplanes derwentensis]